MTRISKLQLCCMVAAMLAWAGTRLQAQTPPAQAPPVQAAPAPAPAMSAPAMSDDSTSAKRGETLFTARGCNTCHNISHTGKMSGPDLGGVVQNRDRDWLRNFLKNTDQMLANDPIATAMLKKYKGAKMPDQHLSDSEVEALINYLETQTH